MEKFKKVISQYPFHGFIIAYLILLTIPTIFFTDLYQSHLSSLIFINIIVAAGLNIVKGSLAERSLHTHIKGECLIARSKSKSLYKLKKIGICIRIGKHELAGFTPLTL